MKRKEAAFVFVGAMITVLALALVALPLFSSGDQIRVIRKNVTISDHQQMTPCSLIGGVFCAAPPNGFQNLTSISYMGNRYYVYNVYSKTNDISTNWTVWFTNSTVYCVTPKWEFYTVCPKG
jgi:hypothetical protein